MSESNDNFWRGLVAAGVEFQFPDPPEEPEPPKTRDPLSGAEETINQISLELLTLERCHYELDCLFVIQDSFFKHPPDSEKRALVLSAERYLRSTFLANQPIGRCCILPKETAFEARARNVEESRIAFPTMVMDYGDWYREIYLHSEHWFYLRKDALSINGDGTCEDCGKTPKSLHVHHKEYRHIFDVTPEDLACLCPTCHKERHLTGVLA